MSERDPLGVTIGAREIYDELVGMRGDVRGLSQHNEATRATLADHEDRLRTIERWKYAVPLTAFLGVGSLITALVQAGTK
ncbi:hypothetical protein OG401_23875 [Kitasatospora purpeofusca]|uniref:hypothetical protein n=1 Tax=Kitasatospora purpeofusca TaxID=67352 RepID=UPI0022574291|nr:hypothetical protein [Kitasatospora purpeofusca]MCX4687303.1 hypothetical protein [Kitasatospora purpeofusca]